MKSCRPLLLVLTLTAVAGSVDAQRAVEWQAHSLVTIGSDRFAGGGIGLALRTNGRMRAGVAMNIGDLDGAVAIRPELLGSFHLNPFKRQGLSPYAGGGVAVVVSRGTSREYIVGFLGVESRPGRSFGWFAEAGFGGGARMSVGVQVRKRSPRTR